MKEFYFKKCMTCPYHLGLIKCIVSPCPTCSARLQSIFDSKYKKSKNEKK